MPFVDRRRLMLEADELLVVLGQDVREVFPPALLRRVLGQGEEQLPAGSRDLVVVEQPFHLTRPQAGLGPLVPADLGRRPPQRRGDGLAAPAFGLPDLAQFGGKPTSAHRRTSWRGHQAYLLAATRADCCGSPRRFHGKKW